MKKVEDKKVNKEEKRKELGLFIKTHILKKAKILSIIGILLFIFIVFVFSTSSVDLTSELETIEKTSLLNDIKERLIILLLILLAGWVPYFYIPAIAFAAYVFMLAGDVALAMETKGAISTLLLNLLPILADVLTVSVITSIGIYMCNYSTKKRRYVQSTSFSLLDVKMQLYQMTRKQDKYEEAALKKQQSIDKMEQNNVKIDYMNIFKIIPIIMLVNILACIIEHLIIN